MAVSVQLDASGASDRIEWVADATRLAQLTEPWRTLAPNPFVSPDWILPWCDAFARPRSLRVCFAWRGERLVGIAPMLDNGRLLENPVNSHTPFYDVAASDDAARMALSDAIAATPQACVALNALPVDSPTIGSFLASEHRRRFVSRPRYVSPIVDTTGRVQAFRASTKPRWHAPLDRFRRKMIREHAATFRIVELPDHLDAVLDRGFAVEASGWKGAAGTAILSDAQTERFYRSVAHGFAERGQTVLSWVEFGSEMVAFDLCLLFKRRLFLLKTGFDERFRQLAPGLVLRLAVIEHCFESDINAHELLGAESEWKLKFADRGRRHLELRMYGAGVRGTSGWAYRRYLRPRARAAYLSARSARLRGQ